MREKNNLVTINLGVSNYRAQIADARKMVCWNGSRDSLSIER